MDWFLVYVLVGLLIAVVGKLLSIRRREEFGVDLFILAAVLWPYIVYEVLREIFRVR